ncbi:MAG: DUF3386 family protein [Cyanophyceae cyanobacterium]
MMKRSRRIFWGLSLLLAIACFTPIPVALAQSAQTLFQTAYENRYTWDEQFPGYRAEVSVNHEGNLAQGIVEVKPDLSVEVFNISDDDTRQLVENQLKMEAIHRRRLAFEQIHGQNRFELVGSSNSGSRIREVGNSVDVYEVDNNTITQVNRTFGDVSVTVDTLGTTKTPQGYLVLHFQTTYRTPKGEVLQIEDVRDDHQKVSRYYILSSREIRYTDKGNPADKPTADIRLDFNDFQRL